jgi:hypothetical protein
MPRRRSGRFASMAHAHSVATQWAHATGIRHRVAYMAATGLWMVETIDWPRGVR